MTDMSFMWLGRPIRFRHGESVATALAAAGITAYGLDALAGDTRYFCGIGACQGCLVQIDGAIAEACLTPAADGLIVKAIMEQGRADADP